MAWLVQLLLVSLIPLVVEAYRVECHRVLGDTCEAQWKGEGHYFVAESLTHLQVTFTNFANSVLFCGVNPVNRLMYVQSPFDILTPCEHVNCRHAVSVLMIREDGSKSHKFCSPKKTATTLTTVTSPVMETTVVVTGTKATIITRDRGSPKKTMTTLTTVTSPLMETTVVATGTKTTAITSDRGSPKKTMTTTTVTSPLIDTTATVTATTTITRGRGITPVSTMEGTEGVGFGSILLGNILGGLSVLLGAVALLWLWCKWLRRRRGRPLLPTATQEEQPAPGLPPSPREQIPQPPTPPPQQPTPPPMITAQPCSKQVPPPPPPPPPQFFTPSPPKREPTTSSTGPLISPEILQGGEYNLRQTADRMRRLQF